MIVTYFNSSSGEIVRVNYVAAETEIAANTPAGASFIYGDGNSRTQYVVSGAIVSRPVIAALTGSTYDLSTLPAGTVLTVTDPEGVSTDVHAQDNTLELTDAGTWRVRSRSPFPNVDFDVEVTVS